jgi:hypothetical protein
MSTGFTRTTTTTNMSNAVPGLSDPIGPSLIDKYLKLTDGVT